MNASKNRSRKKFLCAAVAVAIVSFVIASVSIAQDAATSDIEGELVIFHAGSLSIPFREVSKLFNTIYPNVKIKAEAAGSRDTARKISDLGRSCDVLGSADYKVIDNLLLPEHASFNIRFATNEMVIAYAKHSARREAIAAGNWPQILLEKEVTFGRSDPNRDPCGYRTVMIFQLAEMHYEIPGLAEKLQGKGGMKYIRPKETDLLALLEMGEIDYLFIYRSVASQHRLEFIVLPDEVNLKSTGLSELYSKATVEVTGKKPGEYIERRGAPMIYGITIPNNCENRELAEAWVKLLLSPRGRDIMEANGQPAIAPALTEQYDALPEILQPLCEKVGQPR